jgi:hypothetical protein
MASVIRFDTWETSTGNSVAVVNDSGTITSNIALSNVSVSGDLSVSGNLAASLQSNEQTASYTLVLTDAGKVVECNNSSAMTLTVPTNASVAFEVGTVINVYAMTTNAVTIAGDTGVTVRNAGIIADQYVEVSLRKRATDEWVATGNLI